MRGTIIKRGEKWAVVLDLGRDSSGRRRRTWHSGYRTKREAERAHVELLSSVDHGTYAAPSHLTFGAYLVDEWLPARASTIKPTTLASYEMHVRKHLVPRLGAVELLRSSTTGPERVLTPTSWPTDVETAAAGCRRPRCGSSTRPSTRRSPMRCDGADSPAIPPRDRIRRRRGHPRSQCGPPNRSASSFSQPKPTSSIEPGCSLPPPG